MNRAVIMKVIVLAAIVIVAIIGLRMLTGKKAVAPSLPT